MVRLKKRVTTGTLKWREPQTAYEMITNFNVGHCGWMIIDYHFEDRIIRRNFYPRLNFTEGRAYSGLGLGG
uniref:Uncharacterized protein n=1 Tax=Micrococcus phage Kurnik TaxID=3092208 RepID=A0AAU6R632_9CAUD